jgi:hypothetical protein
MVFDQSLSSFLLLRAQRMYEAPIESIDAVSTAHSIYLMYDENRTMGFLRWRAPGIGLLPKAHLGNASAADCEMAEG